MGYKRHIITPSLPFKHFSFALDDTRAAFRILAPQEMFIVSENAQTFTDAPLKTTEKLSSPYQNAESDKIYQIGGENYCIVAEVIIDKTKPEFERNWIPGCHFVTYMSNGIFRVDVKGGLTFFDHRNTAEYCRHKGGVWLFDLWVRNTDAPVSDCAWSITTTSDSVVVTNQEALGEEWSAEDVMTGGVSKWLNLDYSLTPSTETVEPDGWVTFTFRILDGKTHELASDVNWNNFLIEPVDGYCPHRRVAVNNGVGTFRMKALDLLDGEEMRVKVGVRYWVSRVECIVPVVANDQES